MPKKPASLGFSALLTGAFALAVPSCGAKFEQTDTAHAQALLPPARDELLKAALALLMQHEEDKVAERHEDAFWSLRSSISKFENYQRERGRITTKYALDEFLTSYFSVKNPGMIIDSDAVVKESAFGAAKIYAAEIVADFKTNMAFENVTLENFTLLLMTSKDAGLDLRRPADLKKVAGNDGQIISGLFTVQPYKEHFEAVYGVMKFASVADRETEPA